LNTAYKTIAQASEIQHIVSKSRFIGRAWPVQDEEEALHRLENIRKQHYDASHNCYAYRIGETGATARYSDDGEPGGTAGLPMMEVLLKKDVTNALCIVTRYFGGTLLGAGGLVRAYSHACSSAIQKAQVLSMVLCDIYQLTLGYDKLGKLEYFLHTEGYASDPFEYTEQVNATVYLPQAESGRFLSGVSELFDGSITPVPAGHCHRPMHTTNLADGE
jgi:uncharacterized YigZ family protein